MKEDSPIGYHEIMADLFSRVVFVFFDLHYISTFDEFIAAGIPPSLMGPVERQRPLRSSTLVNIDLSHFVVLSFSW